VNGGELTARAVAAVAHGATIIAADGGLDRAVAAGLRPSRLVGDLDSISTAGREWAVAQGITIDQYDTDKDATDTELALTLAASCDCTDLLVLGGVGDRLDHTLGTIGALGAPALHGLASVRMVWGDSLVHIVHPDRAAMVRPADGTTFSLLALHGECSEVTVTGARWPLNRANLPSATSRGLSNEIVADAALVSVGSGVLTVVQP
jgi:thiamine pyrophosphokinase